MEIVVWRITLLARNLSFHLKRGLILKLQAPAELESTQQQLAIFLVFSCPHGRTVSYKWDWIDSNTQFSPIHMLILPWKIRLHQSLLEN